MQRPIWPLQYLVLIGVAIVIAASVGWYLAKRSNPSTPYGPQPAELKPGPLQKRAVHLYFGDNQGKFLTAEQRVLNQPQDATLIGKQIVEALIQGPIGQGSPTLPPDARLRSFFVADDSTAYVDFELTSFDHHPSGVGAELLSIYSIVNTLVLNVEAIRSVKFLLGGQEAATLAGHVDLSRKFQADMLWVR